MSVMKIAIFLSILAVSGHVVMGEGETTEQPTQAPSNDTTTTVPETITPTPEGTTGATTGNTTSTPPMTTSIPTTPSPDLATKTYNITKNGNETCLLVTMASTFTVNGKTVNVSKDAAADKTKSNCGKLFVNFGSSNWFYLLFKTDNKSFYLDTVEAHINTVDANTTNQKIGKAVMKASYRCASGIDIKLNNNVSMHAANVQFQPFQVTKGQYGTAYDCHKDLSPIIPIVVGSVLAALVVIVVIAYIIGRRRSRTGYEEI